MSVLSAPELIWLPQSFLIYVCVKGNWFVPLLWWALSMLCNTTTRPLPPPALLTKGHSTTKEIDISPPVLSEYWRGDTIKIKSIKGWQSSPTTEPPEVHQSKSQLISIDKQCLMYKASRSISLGRLPVIKSEWRPNQKDHSSYFQFTYRE